MSDNTRPELKSHWDEDPKYPVAAWKWEIKNDETRLGYLEWVNREYTVAAADKVIDAWRGMVIDWRHGNCPRPDGFAFADAASDYGFQFDAEEIDKMLSDAHPLDHIARTLAAK